jgi:4'-phosphopantetheinyl transferase EntD
VTGASLFPSGVVVVEALPWMWETPAFPEEEQAVAGAVARRRREFRAGRHCARAALRELGIPDAALTVGPERAPVWPRGAVGAITHTDGYCAAAVARADEFAGTGLDAEQRGGVADGLVREICTEREWARIAEIDDALTIAFAAKEALHKCLNPPTGVTLEFDEAEDSLQPADGALSLAVVAGELTGLAVGGRYAVGRELVTVGLTLTRTEVRRSSPAST